MFPSSAGIRADAAELLDRVSHLVLPRPPVSGRLSPARPRRVSLCAPRSLFRSTAAAPQLALVKRPSPAPEFVELAYEICEWTPAEFAV